MICDSPILFIVTQLEKKKILVVCDVVLLNMDAPNVGEGETQRYNRRNETGFLKVVPSKNSHHDALLHGKHEGD